jgi:hypothetical protein
MMRRPVSPLGQPLLRGGRSRVCLDRRHRQCCAQTNLLLLLLLLLHAPTGLSGTTRLAQSRGSTSSPPACLLRRWTPPCPCPRASG